MVSSLGYTGRGFTTGTDAVKVDIISEIGPEPDISKGSVLPWVWAAVARLFGNERIFLCLFGRE